MKVSAFQPGLVQRLKRPPRKIVLVRACRIGDFICATPAFRSIRKGLPEADITMVTLPMLEGLVRRSSNFDSFAPFPGYPGLAEQLFSSRSASRFFYRMQSEKFDLAIQMQGSGVNSNPFTLMLGASATAGFVRPGDGPGLLDAALPLPTEGHEILRVLALTRFLGLPDQTLETEFPLAAVDRRQASRLIGEGKSVLIGLHPEARDAARRWPAERFAEVGRRLQQHHGGRLVLFGDTEGRQTAEAVLQAAGVPGIDLSGRLSLGQLGAVIQHLSVLVTNDSGPAHIAYALGTPTVTIFGGKDPARYGALRPGPFRMIAHPIACRPCQQAECPMGAPCLNRVSVDEVVAEAESLICKTFNESPV
ncbi:MAG: glycosyltransferase family 9 protein [Syntrophotaleaceae bacterium]